MGKKILIAVAGLTTFVAGCVLNKKFNWNIGDKVAGGVQTILEKGSNCLKNKNNRWSDSEAVNEDEKQSANEATE
jgi:outer membrane murein-binding lipoprotein Lpp